MWLSFGIQSQKLLTGSRDHVIMHASHVPNVELTNQCIICNSKQLQFSEEPLVPIGCLATAYCLGAGIRSFYRRDTHNQQKMMRLRVAAQFTTLMIFIGYAGWNAFSIQAMPGMIVDQSKEKKDGGK